MIDLKDLVTKDVSGMTVQEIKELITDEYTVGPVKPVSIRIKIIKLLFQVLGYDLNKELLYALASEPRAMLILATAGSGKTTSTQLKLIAEKIYRESGNGEGKLSGDRILCLVYNTHNVPDMVNKHKSLVNKLYASGIEGLDIDNRIKAATIHSLCEEWLKEYTVKVGHVGKTLLEDHNAESFMKTVLSVVGMKQNINTDNISPKDVLSLYNYAKESLLPTSELYKVDKFIDCGLEPEFVDMVFNAYDRLKDTRAKYDYTDMLTKFLALLKRDEVVRTRIQSYYDFIVVDEVQDFTPVMNEIVRYITGPKTPLVCIGDEDQCIYTFKGADVYNTLEFKNIHEGAEVFTLGINRRCGEEIVGAAKEILKDNMLRYNKIITAKKPGGTVVLKPYTSKQGQVINVVKDIMAMPFAEQENTVICYRDRKSSLAIGSALEEKGVPFHILSGYNCFKHELFQHVTDVLEMLYLENDQQAMKALYKCAPSRKEQIFSLIGYNSKKGVFKNFDTPTSFYNINFGELSKSVVFVTVIEKLKAMSINIEKQPLNSYFPELFTFICKYFWNYKMSLNKEEDIDSFFNDMIYRMFNVDLTYPQLRRDLARRKEIVTTNNSFRNGVALSTFHKLKGLEYKNVFIIDACESLFPNFAGIESREYPKEVELKLKECETRLMYVAMTRAKEKLVIYYDEYCPSLYVDIINRYLEGKSEDSVLVPDVEGPKLNNKTLVRKSSNSFVSMLDRFK